MNKIRTVLMMTAILIAVQSGGVMAHAQQWQANGLPPAITVSHPGPTFFYKGKTLDSPPPGFTMGSYTRVKAEEDAHRYGYPSLDAFVKGEDELRQQYFRTAKDAKGHLLLHPNDLKRRATEFMADYNRTAPLGTFAAGTGSNLQPYENGTLPIHAGDAIGNEHYDCDVATKVCWVWSDTFGGWFRDSYNYLVGEQGLFNSMGIIFDPPFFPAGYFMYKPGGVDGRGHLCSAGTQSFATCEPVDATINSDAVVLSPWPPLGMFNEGDSAWGSYDWGVNSISPVCAGVATQMNGQSPPYCFAHSLGIVSTRVVPSDFAVAPGTLVLIDTRHGLMSGVLATGPSPSVTLQWYSGVGADFHTGTVAFQAYTSEQQKGALYQDRCWTIRVGFGNWIAGDDGAPVYIDRFSGGIEHYVLLGYIYGVPFPTQDLLQSTSGLAVACAADPDMERPYYLRTGRFMRTVGNFQGF